MSPSGRSFAHALAAAAKRSFVTYSTISMVVPRRHLLENRRSAARPHTGQSPHEWTGVSVWAAGDGNRVTDCANAHGAPVPMRASAASAMYRLMNGPSPPQSPTSPRRSRPASAARECKRAAMRGGDLRGDGEAQARIPCRPTTARRTAAPHVTIGSAGCLLRRPPPR